MDASTSPAETRFVRLKVPSAYEMVAEAIEREIIEGRLLPGDEVGTEIELSRQFGVNRSTVREGIRILEQSGLVRRAEGRRLHVTVPNAASLTSRITRTLVLHDITFREVFEAAMALEMAAAKAACKHRTDTNLEGLDDNLEASRVVADQPEELAALDAEFHRRVARASHNRAIELVREPVARLFIPTTGLICTRVPEAPDRMLDAHARLIEAIRVRDEAAAQLWMQRHVTDWLKGFQRAGRDPEAPVERALALAREVDDKD
jgi:DNA-binding FadR family transcriptional regulator